MGNREIPHTAAKRDIRLMIAVKIRTARWKQAEFCGKCGDICLLLRCMGRIVDFYAKQSMLL